MKFFNLLQKELKELCNAQMFLSLIVILTMFMLLGNFMTSATDNIKEEISHPKIYIADFDDTDFTHSLIDTLKTNKKAEVKVIKFTGDDYAAVLKDNDIKDFVIIPEGFTDEVNAGNKPSLKTVSRMSSAAMLSNISSGMSSTIELIQGTVSSLMAEKYGITMEDFEIILDPVEITDNTVVGDKSAEIASDQLMQKISMQNMLLPIVVFVLIMMTSQSIITSISNEKLDKTLETLLSAPVSRTAIITAKMLAASIVALLNAGVMTVGCSKFVNASTSGIAGEAAEQAGITVEEAMKQLGLNLSTMDYVLVGVQLFVTIMICLSISIILGALVNDSKSTQTVIMPIMFMAMIPYMISMIADINTLLTVIKYVVYAIPFTHTFSAMSNLMFDNTALFWGGFIYQTIVFLVFMFFALRLFNSDKILTISLNWGQKSKYKKKGQPNPDE